MRYVSTRGEAPVLGFSDALLAGLARDGGLYVPERWPSFSRRRDPRRCAASPIPISRSRLLTPFVGGEIDRRRSLERLVREAYATFRHAAVCPLVQIGAEPLRAGAVPRADAGLQGRGDAAAGAADGPCAGRARRSARPSSAPPRAIPAARRSRPSPGATAPTSSSCSRKGRVSPVQQRQMTTSAAANVHALAVEGTFDDCQALVKDDVQRPSASATGCRCRASTRSTGRASWRRSSIISHRRCRSARPDRPVSFTVPTGNFGDIFAGYAAKRMGLPVERLVIATNDNDILARALDDGEYRTPRGRVATTSPSMDIQVSSNFERLLFEAAGRDAGDGAALHGRAEAVRRVHASTPAPLATIRGRFRGRPRRHGRDGRDDRQAISRLRGYLLDPHTATAVHVADAIAASGGADGRARHRASGQVSRRGRRGRGGRARRSRHGLVI